MHEGNPVLNIHIGAMVHRWLVYIYLLNVPSFSSRYFNKIKRKSRFREIARLIARNALYHIEHSIIANRFRQYFDKRYCLVLRLIFALIVLMVEFGHSTYLTLDRDNPEIGLIHFVRKL